MSAPFASPTATPANSVTMTASGMAALCPSIRLAARMLVSVTTPPIERSMPPTMSAIVWPIAATPRKAVT